MCVRFSKVVWGLCMEWVAWHKRRIFLFLIKVIKIIEASWLYLYAFNFFYVSTEHEHAPFSR